MKNIKWVIAGIIAIVWVILLLSKSETSSRRAREEPLLDAVSAIETELKQSDAEAMKQGSPAASPRK